MQDRINQVDETSCIARPDHTVGVIRVDRASDESPLVPDFRHVRRLSDSSRCAITGPEQLQQITRAVARLIYSITSSARASSDGGTSRPSALAVFGLTASSYLVGA